MKASRVHAVSGRALAPAQGTVSTEATSGAAAECRTASRLDSRGPARLRSPWITAAIAAIGMTLTIAALAPLLYPQSLEDPWPIELLWQNGIAMQVSGYVLLALTFVGLSFSLRKRFFPCCSSSTSSRCTTIDAGNRKRRNWSPWALLVLAATGWLYYASRAAMPVCSSL